MRWWIAALSLVACLMPWRAPFAQTLDTSLLHEAVRDQMPSAVMQRMCYNPRNFVFEARSQITSYGTEMKISPAQIEVAITAELARLRAQEMRWLLEADLDSDLAISAEERDVLVHAASALMQDRLKRVHSLADGDGNDSVSMDELQRYASGKAEEMLPVETRRGMRALAAFDLDQDGWVALAEVARVVEQICDSA